ncbi:transposable element Tcb1 transposase [Trichonephila clavipes]|nr:transposable element Tcb1 transposase [Trichonephila clavipes]
MFGFVRKTSQHIANKYKLVVFSRKIQYWISAVEQNNFECFETLNLEESELDFVSRSIVSLLTASEFQLSLSENSGIRNIRSAKSILCSALSAPLPLFNLFGFPESLCFSKNSGAMRLSRAEIQIIGRLECRRTQLEVSEELGIAQSVISRLWQRFQDDGNVSRCYSTGRPPVTTPNEDRYLAFTAKRNRRSTASDLSRQLSSATGTTVSRQIEYRRLGHIGLYARRPVTCVPLTATHCLLRLTWSREHALRIPQKWSCVMFPDESSVAVWLVWGGIILGSRTDLHVQRVTITGHIYRDVILEQHVRLFRMAMGAEFLFMDDNARSHRANIVDECLQSEDITRIDWLAYSPDLNPIEQARPIWRTFAAQLKILYKIF